MCIVTQSAFFAAVVPPIWLPATLSSSFHSLVNLPDCGTSVTRASGLTVNSCNFY